jgi:hypothetical protein
MWKKDELNNEINWKRGKKNKSNSEKIWTIWKKDELHSEMISKIWPYHFTLKLTFLPYFP